jgi:hypothetical protein
VVIPAPWFGLSLFVFNVEPFGFTVDQGHRDCYSGGPSYSKRPVPGGALSRRGTLQGRRLAERSPFVRARPRTNRPGR